MTPRPWVGSLEGGVWSVLSRPFLGVVVLVYLVFVLGVASLIALFAAESYLLCPHVLCWINKTGS